MIKDEGSNSYFLKYFPLIALKGKILVTDKTIKVSKRLEESLWKNFLLKNNMVTGNGNNKHI